MKCVECGKDLSEQEEQCAFETCSYCELGIPRPAAAKPSEADDKPIAIGHTEPAIPLQVAGPTREIFRITPEGEIESNGKVITHDDAAIGQCMREAAKALAVVDDTSEEEATTTNVKFEPTSS